MKLKLATKIILIVFSGLIIGGIFSIFIQNASYNEEIDIIAQNLQTSSKSAFTQTLADDTKKMSLALDILLQDEHAKEFYTTKDIDCSVLAKRHGGGGHKKASGFPAKDISEIFPVLKVETV